MKIKEVDNPSSEEFVLIESSVDHEMYAIGSSTILKMSDIDDEEYICDNLEAFDDEENILNLSQVLY